jgi:hypothetical protein
MPGCRVSWGIGHFLVDELAAGSAVPPQPSLKLQLAASLVNRLSMAQPQPSCEIVVVKRTGRAPELF